MIWRSAVVSISVALALADMVLAEAPEAQIGTLPRLEVEETGDPEIDEFRQRLAQTDGVRMWSVMVHWLYRSDPLRRLDYLDLLHEYVRPVIESGRPYPYRLTGDGEVVPNASGEGHQLSEQFVQWVEARDLDVEDQLEQVFLDMYPIVILSQIDDPSSSELFLTALESPNFLTVRAGIGGLARLGEEEAIDEIVRALERFPRLQQQLLAIPLAGFGLEETDELALSLVEDPDLQEAIREAIDQRE